METENTIQIIRFNTNEEWLANRANGIGASEVCAAIGASPYCSQMQWWKEKTAARNGERVDKENKNTIVGHWLEGGVAIAFEQVTGYQVIKRSEGDWVAHNTTCEFAYASPDRTFWIDPDGLKHGKNSEMNKGLLECKTTQLDLTCKDPDVNYIYFDDWRIPMSWWLQVQWQLFCTGKRVAVIAAIQLVKREFYWQMIQYDEKFMTESLLPELTTAWKYVIDGVEPPAQTADDAAIKWPKSIDGKTVTVGPETIGTFSRIREIDEAMKPLEKEKKQLTDSLKVMCEDNEALVDADGRVLATYKSNKSKMVFNDKRFAVEHADLYEEYLEEKDGSRILRIK